MRLQTQSSNTSMADINYDRTKKVGSLVKEVELEADDIFEKFKSFTWGVRVILLLERKKEGSEHNKQQKYAMRWVTTNEEQFRKYLEKALFLQKVLNLNGANYRIYSSLNPRHMHKGIIHFKHEQVDQDHGDGQQKIDWYRDIADRFIGALMKESSKAMGRFLIDVDGDQKKVGEVLQKLASIDVEVVYQYASKNGWHIVVDPFNPALFNDTPIENVELKKDALLLLSHN